MRSAVMGSAGGLVPMTAAKPGAAANNRARTAEGNFMGGDQGKTHRRWERCTLDAVGAIGSSHRDGSPPLTTAKAILDEIKPLGNEGYKKIMLRHGAAEPIYGVKIEELKKIQKRIKKDYRLALDLYDTGVYDAMYLAGLIADDGQMTKKDLQRWVTK